MQHTPVKAQSEGCFSLKNMCVINTPLQYHSDLGLWIKHEEKCCPTGPHFSKTRGVFAHIAKRRESIIGVLDTSHSQGGWAVAQACKLLNKQCHLWYPLRKHELRVPYKPQQQAAFELGAELHPLQAGRSAILYHTAKRELNKLTRGGGYMMPNALKLLESVDETALEFARTEIPFGLETILVSASSGTIAAGVQRAITNSGWPGSLVVHMGYSRSTATLQNYMQKMSGIAFGAPPKFVDEGYGYADAVKDFDLPLSFLCNSFYDRKALAWWVREGKNSCGKTLFWNIG